MKLKSILILSFMLIAACSGRSLDESDSALTEVHLQSGFYGHVTVWVNDEIVYDEIMSDQVPFAGPQDKFSLSISRGTALIKVSWGASDSKMTDDFSVQIGSLDKYFLGINIVNNSLSLTLQNTEFLYL